MDQSTHEERSYQPLKTKSEQFKRAIFFLTGYKGILNFSSKNNKFYFAKSITYKDYFLYKLLFNRVLTK